MDYPAVPTDDTPKINTPGTQAAILNVLEDYKNQAVESTLSRKAVLNVLEDLEISNRGLEEQTKQMQENAEILLHKNAVDAAILESIGDAIMVANSFGRVTFVNRAFEALTGWAAAEVLGKEIAAVLPIEDEHGSTDYFLSRIFSEVMSGREFTADMSKPYYTVRKDQTRFPASARVTPVRLNGKVIGLVKTFRDITREMDIDKTKTEFVSLASHQLRTPLSAINWYTEMLLSGDVGPITEGQEKYLLEVQRGNQRMISLVNALLNVTRMSLGTFVLEPEMIDFVGLIRSVIVEQQPDIDKKQLSVTTNFAPYIPIIESDAKLLRMVIQNLVSNAIKYTAEHGQIEIILELDTAGTHFLFSVVDTGYGIPERQQTQIFTRLFRADNVRATDTEGTGLGLYIVKAVIENSGGRVWFESKENIGSAFHIELPVGTTT